MPFGEYLPLDRVLDAARDQEAGPCRRRASRPARRRGRSPRPACRTVQPLICYESLFPGFTRAGARAGGPAGLDRQRLRRRLVRAHLRAAAAPEPGQLPRHRGGPADRARHADRRLGGDRRLRPDRARRAARPGRRGVIDSPLPPALAPTPYERIGSLVFWIMLAISSIAAMIGRMTLRQPTKEDDTSADLTFCKLRVPKTKRHAPCTRSQNKIARPIRSTFTLACKCDCVAKNEDQPGETLAEALGSNLPAGAEIRARRQPHQRL